MIKRLAPPAEGFLCYWVNSARGIFCTAFGVIILWIHVRILFCSFIIVTLHSPISLKNIALNSCNNHTPQVPQLIQLVLLLQMQVISKYSL